jgi:hypothetical protein
VYSLPVTNIVLWHPLVWGNKLSLHLTECQQNSLAFSDGMNADFVYRHNSKFQFPYSSIKMLMSSLVPAKI